MLIFVLVSWLSCCKVFIVICSLLLLIFIIILLHQTINSTVLLRFVLSYVSEGSLLHINDVCLVSYYYQLLVVIIT